MTQDIKKFLINQIPKHSKDIVAYACEYFDVTPTTIHRHINALISQGKVIKTGRTRMAEYFLADSKVQKHFYKISTKLEEYDIWKERFQQLFVKNNKNIIEILYYGFTEIVNNAKEHSEGKNLTISVECKQQIKLTIEDDGIGVFEKIHKVFHYPTHQECLLHLTKGRLTTDPVNHAGEGIFFSSKIFDYFSLEANKIKFIRDNVENDWTLESTEFNSGSRIIMIVNPTSNRTMRAVFNKYTEAEDFNFNKTEIIVKLSKLNEEFLISRSQAKRILENLTEFNIITLDFSKVTSVGQGFVDEIFRVYILKNPSKKILYTNANENVEFMIKRGIKSN